MSEMTLVIGNKNYSSWSLRPWLALKQAGFDFEEVLISLDETGFKTEILKHSPSGRVPALVQGDITVWDSLAICEYAAELKPEAGLWPGNPVARAFARSISCEMHSGFSALRSHMPMNIRSHFPDKGREPGVQEDINRVRAIWRQARKEYGSTTERGGGPFLFGAFSIADAMFAPVVSRFRTFEVELGAVEQAYCDAVWALPAMKDWVRDAENEPMIIESAEF